MSAFGRKLTFASPPRSRSWLVALRAVLVLSGCASLKRLSYDAGYRLERAFDSLDRQAFLVYSRP